MNGRSNRRITTLWKTPQETSRKRSGRALRATAVWCTAWLLTIPIVFAAYTQADDTTGASPRQSRPLYQATQQALDTLTRAEIDREEASLNGQSLDAVRGQCRTAISQLRNAETQWTALLHKSYQLPLSARAKAGWSVQELESLLRNLKVQQARAYRNQALCYPDASPDRINALSLALKQLPDIITLPLDETSVWQARVEQVVCLRLLNTNAEAQQQIKRWQDASPPAKIASKFFGEVLRIDLDEGAVQQALEKVEARLQLKESLTAVTPETDDAILEVLLAARRQAMPQQAAQLTQRAALRLQRISANHGPYWQQRAEVRLGRALTERDSELASTNDHELLSHAAASQYAAGQFVEAVATYDRIANLLALQGNENRQFQTLKTAAAIVRQSQQPAAALPHFRRLSIDHPQHAEAAATHLLAIGLAAQTARDATGSQRGKRFELYLELLREHLQTWPQRPSAETVKQWLARAQLPEVQRQRADRLASLGGQRQQGRQQDGRQQALALYRRLAKDSPNDAELLEAYAKLLATGADRSELREAKRLWLQIEKRSKPGGPRWSRGRQARIELLEQLGEGQRARKLKQLTEILYPSSSIDE